MAFKVFISHSVSPRELAVVYALAEAAAKRRITTFIPDRLWNPQQALPQCISQAIKDSDVVVVLETKFGQHADRLIKEGTEGIQQGKRVLFVVDPEVPNRYQGLPAVAINRSDLRLTIEQTVQQLNSLKLDKEQSDALTWLVVGGLLFLLFSENK